MFGLTSFYFLCFYTIVLILYYIFPKRFQWIILLIASIAFYYFSANFRGLLFLSYGVTVTYFGARWIANEHNEKKKRIAVTLTVILILLQLFVLKYVNFFIYTGKGFASLFHINLGWKTISLMAPLGITFYTFILLGYVIDVYRETIIFEKNILKLSLFGCYFPQMTSGPFTRFNKMKEQLYSGHSFDYNIVTQGMQRIAWGFFKKLVISERMAVIVNAIYSNYTSYSGIYIIFATICFAMQLYTDFSGCMDIILGVSESFAITLPENFRTPFFSRSVSEYWRRWHITLGIWFKDYVFYPVMKSEFMQTIGGACKRKFGKIKGKKIPTYISMFILWFLVGLWHGGSWNYIIGSGLLHWFFIVMGEIFEPVSKKVIKIFNIRVNCFSWHLYQQIRTFAIVCIGFIFFRAGSMSNALHMIKYIMTNTVSKGLTLDFGLDKYDGIVGIISLVVLLVISLLQEYLRGNYVRVKISEQNILFRWICWYLLIFSIIIFGFYGPGYDATEFIYQGF